MHIILFFLFFSSPEVERFVKKFQSINSLKASFREKVTYEHFERKSEFRGMLYIKRPSFLRMEVDSPESQIIIFDGENGWFLLPNEGKVYKRDASFLTTNIKSFLVNEKFFKIKLAGQVDLGYVFQLTPRDTLSVLKEVHVTVDRNYNPLIVKIHTRDGTIMDFQLSNLMLNIALNDTLFRFKEKDARIIEK